MKNWSFLLVPLPPSYSYEDDIPEGGAADEGDQADEHDPKARPVHPHVSHDEPGRKDLDQTWHLNILICDSK